MNQINPRTLIPNPQKDILVYQGDAGAKMTVKTDGETVWLTQEQMCQLPDRLFVGDLDAANEKLRAKNEELRQKMRTIGVRPSRVTSDDPAYLAAQQAKKDALTVDERLKRLDAQKAQGLLTDEEYASRRSKILSEL